ncbi:SecDF P1 head subdomain-containing protein [Kutzneria chonburiensis]|uniref:Precorrin-3B C(17)-methyltransferase n=1 Tax=Kutzneria chonburiensis TaxID=1483604 RepID=A0ABV6MUL2_9PSEU|nr:precorrin-3B C(17)-methyltransferase [Kutzneria chonburiensis]
MAVLRALAVVSVLGLAGCSTAVAGQASPAVHPQLRFRPVLVDPTTGAAMVMPSDQRSGNGQSPRQSTTPAEQRAALEGLDCSAPDPLHAKDDPAKPLATCDQQGEMKYVLGPSFLDGSSIKSATAGQDQGRWTVTLTFTTAGAKTWSDYTGHNVGSQVAVALDGRVLSAPTINQQITGDTEISGSFTEQTAKDLAAALSG